MTDLAIFLATSGHSGVDRVMHNLVFGFVEKGLTIDLLQIRNHGPYWRDLPVSTRLIDLGASHVTTALPALIAYLRDQRPRVLLTDKDRVNRTALLGKRLAGVATRVAVRIGTTVSVNLARRGGWDRACQRLSMRRLYPWANVILLPSKGAAEDFLDFSGLPKSKVAVVPSPIVTADLRSKVGAVAPHPWLQPGQPPVILGVGELCSRKDFATLIRAFAKLRQRRRCRLIILGEGRQRPYLEKLVNELGVESSVGMPGFHDPFPWLGRSAVFASTSRCEGLPVALIEALALGIPAVAADCPSGPREILDGGRYGPLVPVGDANQLAQAMDRLLADPLPPAALRQAVKGFTLENSVRAYRAALGLG